EKFRSLRKWLERLGLQHSLACWTRYCEVESYESLESVPRTAVRARGDPVLQGNCCDRGACPRGRCLLGPRFRGNDTEFWSQACSCFAHSLRCNILAQLRRRRAALHIAAHRPFEPEMLPQRTAFIFAAEQAAALQLGDHELDEVIKPARQIGRHHVEP